MADTSLTPPGFDLRAFRKKWGVWLLALAILAVLIVVSPAQGWASASFATRALLETAPFLITSIVIAAYASASGADNLIAKAFSGAPALMVVAAALVGAFSPFCSCGVIPLVAALLAMGVPLSAVMAFWLASPVMDPSMFALTAGVLGLDFAIAKTLAAVFLGLFGGYGVLALERAGGLTNPLRPEVGNGGCGGARLRAPKEVVWAFWSDRTRVAKFGTEALNAALFLGKWLFLAYVLESLMLAYVPAEMISAALGGDGPGTVALATLVGVPAYLNGYAALPLVGGLIEQGMGSGAGLAFLVAGGVSSLPAAIAVWALARPPVFALYLAFAFSGSFVVGMTFGLWG